MSEDRQIPQALDAIVDLVFAYKPKPISDLKPKLQKKGRKTLKGLDSKISKSSSPQADK